MILEKIRFNQDDLDKFSRPEFADEADRLINATRSHLVFDSYYLPSELREHYRNLVRELDNFLLSCSNSIYRYTSDYLKNFDDGKN